MLIQCRPKVAEEEFASFRKLSGRNLCPSLAKSGFPFFPFSLCRKAPAMKTIRMGCLPAKGCRGRSSLSGKLSGSQSLSVSQAPVLEEERGRRCKKAHLIIIGLWMRKKVVSLSRFRRTPIRIKRPHFLIMGYLNLRLPPRKGRLFCDQKSQNRNPNRYKFRSIFPRKSTTKSSSFCTRFSKHACKLRANFRFLHEKRSYVIL